MYKRQVQDNPWAMHDPNTTTKDQVHKKTPRAWQQKCSKSCKVAKSAMSTVPLAFRWPRPRKQLVPTAAASVAKETAFLYCKIFLGERLHAL